MDTTISISGMSCGHCVAAVRKALATVPGVVTKDVTIGAAVIDTGADDGALAAVDAALEQAGYDLVTGGMSDIGTAKPEA